MKQDMIKAVFHTHDRLPPEWEHVNGRILNRCFVDYAAVEQLFGSSVTYFDRIRKYDLESVVQMNHGLAESIRFTDQEMQEKARKHSPLEPLKGTSTLTLAQGN